MRTKCPSCGQHIDYPQNLNGQVQPCPACGKDVELSVDNFPAKTWCAHCGVPIGFELEEAGREVTCPACAGITRLVAMAGKAPKPVRPIAPTAARAEAASASGKAYRRPTAESDEAEAAGDCLHRVRGQTCYFTLRLVINIGAVILFVALGLGIVQGVLGMAGRSPVELDIPRHPLAWAAMIVSSLIGIVLVEAVREWALLLVDIADLLVESARKK